MVMYTVTHTEKRNARLVTSRPMTLAEAEAVAADLRNCGDLIDVAINIISGETTTNPTTRNTTTCSDCARAAREKQLNALVHETTRGWIVAHWNDRAAQYQADRYVRSSNGDAHTAVACAIETLARDGSVKKYASRAVAARTLPRPTPSSEYWPRTCTHRPT